MAMIFVWIAIGLAISPAVVVLGIIARTIYRGVVLWR